MKLVYVDLILTHTINALEVVWTVFSTVGCIIALLLVRKAIGDLLFLHKESLNHYREFAAMTTVWTFASLAIMQFAYLLIGIMSMVFPSPNNQVSDAAIAITCVFIITSFIFNMMAWLTHVRKERLVFMIKEDLLAQEVLDD